MHYSFSAELEQWQGDSGWFFVRVPIEYYDELYEISSLHDRRGFGSIKVSSTIGSSTWSTSIFPDSKAKSYILFIKKAIRSAEDIAVGDTVQVEIVLV